MLSLVKAGSRRNLKRKKYPFFSNLDDPFGFFDPRAEHWSAPDAPTKPSVIDTRSHMTNEFDSIFSEVMESTTKPSIQTSNADDIADLDELISMAADEQNKHFYPHLPPDLPTNPDEILLPGEDDDDETPTSPISKAVTLFTPELNNSADSSIGTSRSFIFILELLMIIEINEDAS
jgi:hypothetical protein